MKVFALGGYGKVGFPASKLLAQSDLVTKIAIVGRSLERAEKAATEIGEKAIAVHADGADGQKLTSLLAGYDIIMNAAHNGTVLPAIRAAIRTGTHYCDPNGAIEQALQLLSGVEAAGVTAIVASGIGPGISNLMGVHVARRLEEVEQLQRGLAGFINFQSGGELTPRQLLRDPRESLVALHEFRPFITTWLKRLQKEGIRAVLEYQDGRWVEVDPIRGGLNLPHPESGTIASNPYVSWEENWGSLERKPPSRTVVTGTAVPVRRGRGGVSVGVLAVASGSSRPLWGLPKPPPFGGGLLITA